MPRPRLRNSALTLALLAALVCAGAPTASAAEVTASDGTTQVVITTPIVAPQTGACTPVPYSYTVADDVEVATTVIVDANGGLVARGNQLIAGVGAGELNVCGANLSGKTSPYTLQLQITYTAASEKAAATVSSATFGFAPRAIRCRKTTRPHKGRVQAFAARSCPRGWTPARG